VKENKMPKMMKKIKKK